LINSSDSDTAQTGSELDTPHSSKLSHPSIHTLPSTLGLSNDPEQFVLTPRKLESYQSANKKFEENFRNNNNNSPSIAHLNSLGVSLFPSPHTPNMPNNPYTQVRIPYQNMMAGSMIMVPNMGTSLPTLPSPNAYIQMQMQMQSLQQQHQQQQQQQQQIQNNIDSVPKSTFKKKNLMINIPEGKNQCVPLRVQTPQETSRTERHPIISGDTTPALPSPLGFGDVNLQLPLSGDIGSYLPTTSHFWPYPSPRSANAPPQPFPKTEEVITPTSASLMTPNLDNVTFMKTEDSKKRKAEELSLHQ